MAEHGQSVVPLTHPDDTLGYLRDMGMGITAYCDDCHHAMPVLDALIAQYGARTVYIARKWPLRCRCNSTNVTTRVTASRVMPTPGGLDKT